MDFLVELESMRRNFETARPSGMRLHRPWWMFADEELSHIYTEKERLLSEGRVYYAHLVQANTHLFRAFPPFDYPAQIVFSTDPAADRNPRILADAAVHIYSYKHREEAPPKGQEELVECVKDERDRSTHRFVYTVEDRPVWMRMQTLMVYRKHLPKRILEGALLPIVACPARCRSVLILPKTYWTATFTENWQDGSVYDE